MTSPFFTCIIPLYNVEKHIHRTINSIISQNYDNYEIILIDDGSTDNSSMICKAFIEKMPDKIRMYRSKNLGVSNARNIGIKQAKGEYIYFIDSDDELYKNDVLEQFYNAIKRNNNINLLVQGYTTCYINERTKEKREDNLSYNTQTYNINDKANIIRLLPNGFMFVVWNKVFKKEIIVEHDIKFKNQQMEDFQFVLDYLQHINSFMVLDYIGYKYYRRSTEQTLVTQIRDNMFEDYVNIHKQLNELFGMTFEDQISNIMFPQYYSCFIKYLMRKPQNYNIILQQALSNKYIINSLKAYHPQSFGESMLLTLIKYRLFNIYRLLSKILRKCKK